MTSQYQLVLSKANEIETELKRLGRWEKNFLPEGRFENMGPFGSRTMSFEQWIQFVLIERIHSIIDEQGEFPSESNVGIYAVREFDTDPQANVLTQLLSELEALINSEPDRSLPDTNEYRGEPILGSIEDLPLPTVVYQLAEVLPSFEGDGLEAQLQTFDMFLTNTEDDGRKAIVQLLYSAANKTTSSKERLRIRKAAMDIDNGGNATAPHNHEESMRKYREEFRKGYPESGDQRLT